MLYLNTLYLEKSHPTPLFTAQKYLHNNSCKQKPFFGCMMSKCLSHISAEDIYCSLYDVIKAMTDRTEKAQHLPFRPQL